MAMNTNTQLLQEKQDSAWIRQSLFVPLRGANGLSNKSRAAEFPTGSQFSYATLAFSDTSLGGNRSINPRPQFTKFADPVLPSLLARTNHFGNPSPTETMGMGRYYAEAIDQNAQRIFLQFGVPAYNSLTNFFTTFYDAGHSNMANSGEVGGSLLHTIGKYAGFITFWTLVPELCLANLLYGTAKKLIYSANRRPMSKFYYMKPTMMLYWSTVTTIVNALSVNMKLVQGITVGMATRPSVETGSTDQTGNTLSIDSVKGGISPKDIEVLSKILPDIYLNGNGGIDIRAVANRYERLANAHEKKFNEIRETTSTDEEAAAAIKAYLETSSKSGDLTTLQSINEYANNYAKSASGKGKYLLDKMHTDLPVAKGAAATDTSVQDGIDNANKQASIAAGNSSIWTGLAQHIKEYAAYTIAELRDGSAFVSFIVEWESHVSESFNNSTRESDIAAKMNETSRSARSKLFDFANGNVGDGIVADTIESVIKGVGEVISGVAESVNFSGLAMLGGKAFADIPEFWDSSSTSLPSSNYEIQLRSPYGNPISILTNILVPTAMLIAGAAPRSAGRNAYTGPFLCKLWQKGRTQIQLGMITSLNITRGTGNVGWNIQHQPIGIDINLSITNLSKMLYVPITTELSASDLLGLTIFDEDTNFTDYMAVLGSLGLAEQYYASSRWRLRANFKYTQFKSFLTVESFLTWGATETLPGDIIAIFARQGALGGY